MSCLEAKNLPRVEFLGAHFETLQLPLRDSIEADIGAAFPDFLEFASTLGPDDRLLVHCQAGVSRSGALATALLMTTGKQTFFEAVSSLRERRPRVLPNIGFASHLQHLESRLHGPQQRGEVSSLARYLREVCQVPAETELLEEFLAQHDYDAPMALRSIFGGEIPRVVQGVRL